MASKKNGNTTKLTPKTLDEIASIADRVIDELLAGKIKRETANTFRNLLSERMRAVVEPRKVATERRKTYEFALKYAEAKGKLGDEPLMLPEIGTVKAS